MNPSKEKELFRAFALMLITSKNVAREHGEYHILEDSIRSVISFCAHHPDYNRISKQTIQEFIVQSNGDVNTLATKLTTHVTMTKE